MEDDDRAHPAPGWEDTLQGDEPLGATIKATTTHAALLVRPRALEGATVRPIAGASGPASGGHAAIDPAAATVAGDEATGVTAFDASGSGGGHPYRTAGAPPPPSSSARYELVEPIGRGGMGVVYAAEQTSLRRRIALKMLADAPAGADEMEQRFISEAMVTGDLDHPNIVPVHDLGRDADGNLYMAMKLVRGESWEDRLEREGDAMDLEHHLEILLKVCNAVAFAHARGIVHRDLKPDNVMVGAFGEVLVMDWGIAIDVSEPVPVDRKAESRSETSARSGTPLYMAPESARGDGGHLAPTTDVYLLGGILYRIVTGHAPHEGKDVWEVLDRAAKGAVRPPEDRAPDRAIPRELGRIAMKALAVRAVDRFPTVAAFEEAIRAFTRHQDSIRLSDEGVAMAERLRTPGRVPRAARYAAYAEALARFDQALRSWGDNDAAREAQAGLAAAYADEALDRGDAGLSELATDVLAANPRADPKRLSALQAALRRRSASRVRAFAMALVMVLGVTAILLGAQHLREAAQEDQREEQGKSALRSAAAEGLKAARAGDVRGVDRALSTLRGSNSSGERSAAVIEELGWARWALLWRAGRRDELFEDLLNLAGDRQLPELADRLAARPAVAGTRFLTRIQAHSARGRVRTDVAFRLLREEASLGAPPALLSDALAELHVPPHGDGGRASARALLEATLWSFAREARLEAGDAEGAEAAAARGIPFLLSEAPFGGADVGPATDAPVRLLAEASALVAYDEGTGLQRWRVVLPEVAASVVPCADGTFFAVGRGQAVRVGADGRVLARVFLGGDGILAYPDPIRRDHLVVLIAPQIDRGVVEEVRLEAGSPAPPMHAVLFTELAPFGKSVVDKDALAAAARADPGAPSDPGALADFVRARVLGALRAGGDRDPTNPAYPLAVLQTLGREGPAAERAALARSVVELTVAPPNATVRIGTELERAGFRDEADRLYRRAAETFRDGGGNANLDVALVGNPALFLRRLGGELFEAGNVARALELVEIGRSFSTFAEGDEQFYQRYVAWLDVRGREREREREAMAARAAGANEAGGTLGLPAHYLVAVDVGLFALVALPVLVAALFVRLYRRARVTLREDLFARGMRTRAERLLAFVTHPRERLAFTFLAYATRPERLALALLTLSALLASGLVASRTRTIGRMSASPTALSSGHAGAAGAMHEFRELARRRPGPHAFHLLAEGSFFRGDLAGARAQLERAFLLDPRDSWAQQNLALLDELSGDVDRARAGYAAVPRGEAGAVARINLARLERDSSGETAAALELAHRDRVAFVPGRPTWARAPASDLHAALVPNRSLGAEAVVSVLELTRSGNPTDLFAVVGENQPGPGIRYPSRLLIWAAVFTALASLIAVPLPVRRTLPAPTPSAARPLLERWLSRRMRETVLRVVGVALPGAWDLLFGRPAAGAAVLLVFASSGVLRTVLRTGGILGSLATANLNTGYFADAPPAALFYPSLSWLMTLCTVVLVASFAGHLLYQVLAIRRAWRPAAQD